MVTGGLELQGLGHHMCVCVWTPASRATPLKAGQRREGIMNNNFGTT